MEWLYQTDDPLLETLAGCLLIIILVIAVSRIVGLRSFAKFSIYDFAITIAIGSIISSVLTSSTSVLHGAVAIAGLLLLTLVFSYGQRRSSLFKALTSNTPMLLMDGPNILYDNLAIAQIEETQLVAKLREANVLNYDQVYAVVLESTGDISVLHRASSEDGFEERMLLGVSEKGRTS